jgi:hypothetical protein
MLTNQATDVVQRALRWEGEDSWYSHGIPPRRVTLKIATLMRFGIIAELFIPKSDQFCDLAGIWRMDDTSFSDKG